MRRGYTPGTRVLFVERWGYGRYLGIPDRSLGYVMPPEEPDAHLGVRVFFPDLATFHWVWGDLLVPADPEEPPCGAD
jgi:hypothetical protein